MHPKRKDEENENKATSVEALLRLLDDSDEEVYNHVFDKLLSLGPDIIPNLEDAWSGASTPLLHTRIEEVIHRIKFEGLYKDFKRYILEDKYDLLTGSYLVARYQFPDVTLEEIKNEIEEIRKKIWLEVGPSLTAFEHINVFNHIFYGTLGFEGNADSDKEPNEFCLNHVLEHKIGNSLSLGILYIILSQSLELPVYGLNLPRHFALVFCKDFITGDETYDESRLNVMFYINPLNKGTIFTRNEIKGYLEKVQMESRKEYYIPCDSQLIIHSLLINMQAAYRKKNDDVRVQELASLIELIRPQKD